MTTAPTPVFHVHGDLSREAVSALARLLIDHARRELESEEQRAEQDQQTTPTVAAKVQGVFQLQPHSSKEFCYESFRCVSE